MQVLFFGVIREKAGTEMLHLHFSGTVGEMREELYKKFPGLVNHPFRMAVNKQMASDNDLLTEKDIVALLPPFSGG